MIPKLAYAAIAMIVVAVAVYALLGYSRPQTVAEGDTVSVYYTGKLSNGTVFDSTPAGSPSISPSG